MKKEHFMHSEVTIEGQVEIENCERGYLLKVGKEGGSVFMHGKAGHVGGVKWSSDKFITLPIRYDELHTFYFHLNFHAADGTYVEADFASQPFVDVEVSFPLTFLNLETVFMPRTPGRLKNMMHGRPQKPEDIEMVELYIPKSGGTSEIFLGLPYLTDHDPVVPFEAPAQLDRLGQWKIKDWEGKTLDETELVENLRKYLNEPLPKFPLMRSRYGGELSMKREGTGFFRIHKESGKYWLCDPEGYLMFSSGIDLISPNEYCPVDGIECLFEELPPRDVEYANAWEGNSVSFHTANLIRAFGENWYQSWSEITKKRLLSWGVNGVGNWSSDFAQGQEITYFIQKPFPTTKKKLFRSMPDVFSEEYYKNSVICAEALIETRDDPYLVGYFLRNEPDWAFGTYNIAGIMLEKEQNFVSKDVFIDKMKKKYCDVDEFNKAWRVSFRSFDELKKPITKPWTLSEAAEADLHEFTRDIIREYIRVPSLAYRAVDPNHLNLGLRWGWLENEDLTVGCEYIDVFSINHYKEAPECELFELIHELTNLPIIIGEFQVGSLDVGLASNGMFGVTCQEERGHFYQYYMEKAAEIPYLIGAHYFQWNDQPTLGRFDGENLNLGVVDVCNRPYEAFVSIMRDTHARLAAVHAGNIPPTTRKSKLVPKEGF